jgi:hypothetical protein
MILKTVITLFVLFLGGSLGLSPITNARSPVLKRWSSGDANDELDAFRLKFESLQDDQRMLSARPQINSSSVAK